MSPKCANKGGLQSLVQIDHVSRLEEEQELSLAAVNALHAWEARSGEIVTVADPEGCFYRARLTRLNFCSGKLIPFQKYSRPVESPLNLEVYQALPEKERFELVLQKLTELGVNRIVPYVSERSTTLERRDAHQKKSHRWPNVILRASKQCRRGMIPELFSVLTWKDALAQAARADLKVILYEGKAMSNFKRFFAGKRPARISIFVGPEGGFAQSEIKEAMEEGFLPLSLGPRIMRTETAAIIGAGIIQYELGDLG